MIDDRTTYKNYPLPHPLNIASQDVVRMREAYIAIDADMERVDAICTRMSDTFDREKFEKFLGLWECEPHGR
ncbi:hypothetical protein FACS189449_08550 [Alphaproteobacteria bacterium]|nr:hypothetical protein FACS189449_08550 [Alphaproteobacteria bacterium]